MESVQKPEEQEASEQSAQTLAAAADLIIKDNEDGKEIDSVENDDSFESDIYDKSVGYILPNNAVADNRIRDKIDKD